MLRYILAVCSLLFSCNYENSEYTVKERVSCGFAGEICESDITGLETNPDIFYSQLRTLSAQRHWDSQSFTKKEAKIKVVKNNMEGWYARWKMISEAKEYIDLTYFIIEDDIFGRSLLGLIHEKIKKDGIKVRFMTDDVGPNSVAKNNETLKMLKELHKAAKEYNSLHNTNKASVEIKVYNPLYKTYKHIITQFLNDLYPSLRNVIFRVFSRNHDKILLVDGKRFITGGRNISRDYFLTGVDHPTAFFDTDIIIESTAVTSAVKEAFNIEFEQDNRIINNSFLSGFVSRSKELRTYFLAMDSVLKGTDITTDNSDYLENILRELKSFKELSCHVQREIQVGTSNNRLPLQVCYKNYDYFKAFSYYSRNFDVWDKTSYQVGDQTLNKKLADMIKASEKEIIMQSAYVVYGSDIWNALNTACNNNKNMKIWLYTASPLSTDSVVTQAWFFKEWKQRLAENSCMRIVASNGSRQLHSKTFIFDRTVAAVGSYNLDMFSYTTNSEIILATKDKSIAMNLALQIIFNDIYNPQFKTSEYKIQRYRNGQPKLDQNGEPIAEPGHSPEEVIDGLGSLKESAYKLFDFLTKFEYLRDFS